MRRTVGAVCAVLMVMLAGARVTAAQNGSTPNGRPFLALQAQVDTLTRQIDQLRGDNMRQDELISALGAAVLLLEARMATAEATIEEIQAHDAFMDQWIEELDGRWRAAETRLTAQADDIQRLYDADRALHELLTALNLEIDDLETRLASLGGQVSSLSSALESRLAAVNATLAGLQTAVNSKQAAITQACLPGSSIRQINAATGAVSCEVDDASSGGIGRLAGSDFMDSFRFVPPGGSATSSAFCPTGQTATGGGFNTNLPGMIYLSAPATNGWTAAAQNPTTTTGIVRAYTRCARVVP